MENSKIPDPERVFAVFKDVPCTNRETAAEKAAAHEWMEKELAIRRKRTWPLRALEKFRREREGEKRRG